MTSTSARADALESARHQFRDELVSAGLLIPLGIDGLYGRSGVFEAVIEGVDAVVRAKGHAVHGDRAAVRRFPRSIREKLSRRPTTSRRSRI